MVKHLLLVFLEAYESHFVDSSKIIDELETSYLKNVTQVTKNKLPTLMCTFEVDALTSCWRSIAKVISGPYCVYLSHLYSCWNIWLDKGLQVNTLHS